MKVNHKINRRTMVGGLGAGMLSIGILPLFTNITYKVVALEDPRGKYPKPPFKGQKQPWPGLA